MGRRSIVRNNFGELRRRLGYKQRRFASELSLDLKGLRTPHLEKIERGALPLSYEVARRCTLVFGVSQESIVKNDGVLLNTKGKPWTYEDIPGAGTSVEERINLILAATSEPSEAIASLLTELRSLEEASSGSRGVVFRKKLLEIASVAQYFEKRERELEKAFADGSIRGSFEGSL